MVVVEEVVVEEEVVEEVVMEEVVGEVAFTSELEINTVVYQLYT